jgi:hypothetical protein
MFEISRTGGKGMNERIRELARQSGALPTQDCGVPQWYIDEDEFEKFAEMIVKECAHIAWLYSTEDNISHTKIREHFGVE